MKDCLTSSSNSTKATPSLPEVLVFDKDNEIDTKDSNQTLINKNSLVCSVIVVRPTHSLLVWPGNDNLYIGM